MLETSVVEIEKRWRRERGVECRDVLEKSVAEKCCREVLEKSVGEDS